MTAIPVGRTTDAPAPWRAEARRGAVRLVPGAVLVWLTMCMLGYLLTHPLADAGFTSWEAGADRWFAGHRSAWWNSVTNAASVTGDTPAAIAMSVLAFFVLRVVLHRWRESILLAVSMVGEVAIFSNTTAIVGRQRPLVPHLDGSPPTSSFPSGHTAASTTLYGLLAVIVIAHCTRTAWRAIAVALAAVIVVSIAMSRLYRGMHFPTDLIGGIVLGALWISITTSVLLYRQQGAGGRPRGHR